MEADELKKELFVSFRSSGVLGSIKSHLRAALLQQLRHRDESLFHEARKQGTRPCLEERLLASTFLEYLEAFGFTFTQSVFVPESRMDSWPPFSHDEMVQILRLDLAPCSLTQESPGSGKRTCLVQQLITIVQDFLGPAASKRDASTQTEEVGPKKLEGWLKDIDEAFRKKLEIEEQTSSMSLEERMTKLYQDFDNQVRAEVEAQVSKIREFELSQVRMEEAAIYRRQLASARKDLDDMQKTLHDHLSQQEAAFIERMHAKQQEIEFSAYEQRQELLENTEDIRSRAEKLRLDAEEQERALKQREDVLRTREMQVKVREDDVNRLRDFLHAQADEVLAVRKSHLEKDYQTLHEKLMTERATLEANQLQLMEEQRTFATKATSARTDKELVQALYRRLSAEENQRKSLLSTINQLEEKFKGREMQ